MKIAFVTTQTLEGSTVVGRVLPLARELAKKYEVYLIVHRSPHLASPHLRGRTGKLSPSSEGEVERVKVHEIGSDPFVRADQGKKRLKRWALAGWMIGNTWRAAWALRKIKPDVAIIVKALPENVLAVSLYLALRQAPGQNNLKIVLDSDDFELTANKLSSLTQRAAVHWAERRGAAMADKIVAATPFLADHFEQLTGGKKQPVMIVTGINSPHLASPHLRGRTGKLSPSSEGEVEGVGVSKSPALLYIGSVSISSGHRIDLLPEILAAVREEHPEARLTIAGSGDDVVLLKKKFAAAGLETAVTWYGRFFFDEVPKLIASQPILLDPIDGSIANRAKSSFRVAVAAVAGLPIVTSDIGIRPYWLPQDLQWRFFAWPADGADYAEKVLSLLQQPLIQAERQRMQDQAKQYSWQNLAAQYEELLL